MGVRVDLFEPFCADMGVNLGGGKVFVAEHFLHTAQVRPGIEQMGGE